MSTPDHYKVLQVDPEAEDEVVQAAYRRLARKYHPDVASGPEAATRMAAINAAWAVLKDPAARAAYDGRRTGHARPPERQADPRPDAAPASAPRPRRDAPPPEETSPNWTSGRSMTGGGYDRASMRAPEGHGAAGPPPGDPSGSVLNFGRYAGWSLGEVARRDLEYVEWLDRAPIGRQYRDEVDRLLRAAGRRTTASAEPERRGLFRRR